MTIVRKRDKEHIYLHCDGCTFAMINYKENLTNVIHTQNCTYNTRHVLEYRNTVKEIHLVETVIHFWYDDISLTRPLCHIT